VRGSKWAGAWTSVKENVWVGRGAAEFQPIGKHEFCLPVLPGHKHSIFNIVRNNEMADARYGSAVA